jgi:two-component system, cell cycle sensor histidine kinase and response regulator CckA
LMGGLVMATWIGLAAYAAGTERFRAKEVAAANEELKREIAGRKQAEEALIEAQKMEAVGRLAGGVAHDFNNMLMVIRGHATLLLSRLSPESPQRTEVSEIVKTTGRASSLTRQLLALGRKQVLKPRVLSLNALVIQVAELLPPVLGGDIRVIMDLDPDLGRVRADASQIEQIIMNLVFNARDAMAAGGELTVRTANADLDESWVLAHPEVRPGPHVMLAVHDTGCGMDRETQSHVFEPFFTTKDQSQGSGLGLATVYGTVHQSGGCVTISSTLGEGTTIQIYLPRVEEAIEEMESPQGLSRPSRGVETILVVEDDDAVRRMTREFLLIEGYTIVEARSAAEAMDLLRDDNQRVDLVLTDVIMPGMKGSELGESLAKLDSSIRVLYMSAYTEEAVVNFGFLGSGAAFIEKPFSPDELARKVREVLGAKRDSLRDASHARYASEAS